MAFQQILVSEFENCGEYVTLRVVKNSRDKRTIILEVERNWELRMMAAEAIELAQALLDLGRPIKELEAKNDNNDISQG